jgi:hypothetical protein
MPKPLNIKQRQFNSTLESDWRRLDQYSNLFTSWSWCSEWWCQWHTNFDLELYTFEDDSGVTHAIVPFFSKTESYIFNRKELFFLGNLNPNNNTVFSEYPEIIYDPNYRKEVAAALYILIQHIEWDIFHTPFFSKDGLLTSTLEKQCKLDRRQFSGCGALIPTDTEFTSYLAKLGKNTRLKLFNRRRYLNEHFDAKQEYAHHNDVVDYLNQLNTLHAIRWGKACFTNKKLAFHTNLCIDAAKQGNLRLSRLIVNGEVVSVLYNIVSNQVEYNLQAGYLEKFDKKLSLGTLHLGYAIERAFADESIVYFDLLVGEGKNTPYKNSFRGENTVFKSCVYFNSWRGILFYAFRKALLKFRPNRANSTGQSS